MNAEEVKVPDVEGHWQSIEIFLFSNGQQYSPPRKYHLRADELNMWDDTLNLLAQSHYGFQSPLINLYTTDGQLVESPLELKDGLAYVAVTPPDAFIDAGYQKYLIKASRSWEKRQARKKIPERISGELCCLCPEKEWCCDFQTCCLCHEKEVEGSLESLLHTTEHPELRRGNFMSSTPSKPSAADDYSHKSGKIASTAGEHTVRPGEYGASPLEFGYSPVKSTANSNEYEARLVEYGTNPSEHVLRLSENGSRLGEFRSRLEQYGAKSNENATRPGEYEAYSVENAVRLNKNGDSLDEFAPRLDKNVHLASKNGVRLVEYGVRLNENRGTPVEYIASLIENGPRLSKDAARLKENGTRPGENAATPGEYETRPRVNRAKPGEYRVRPGEYKMRPSINGAKPSEHGMKPGKHETRPSSINEARLSINAARSGEYKVRLSEQGPSKYIPRRSINGDKSSEYGVRPGKYVTRPTVNVAKPSEYKAKPVENKTRPSINGIKANECSAKPAKYETKPGINGVKPSEYNAEQGENETTPTVNGAVTDLYKDRLGENETKLSVNADKLSEFGARPGENEIRSSVYEARPRENETRINVYSAKSGDYGARLSINGTKPSKYGARPGEHETRLTVKGTKPSEYKTGPGENGAKRSEYKPRPGENETKPSEYKARLGESVKLDENKTRPSVNADNLSEYGARPEENETKPSISGAKSGDYGARPSINGAKPDEYGARLGEYEIKLSVNGTRHCVEARQSINAAKPSQYGARTGEYETRPSVNGAMSGEHRARPGECETRPNVNGVKPGEYRARTGEYVDRSAEQRTRLDEYDRSRPAKGGSLLDEDGFRETVHETRSGNDAPWWNKIESKKEAYEIGLHDNERILDDNVDRPDEDTVDAGEECKFRKRNSILSPICESEFEKKGECGITEGDQRDKQIDFKGTVNGNNIRGGERRVSGDEQSVREIHTINEMSEPRGIKIKNSGRPSTLRGEIVQTRRLSGQIGAKIEQGGRTGELTTEFEHGGTASEQKGRETNIAGRTGVNADRLSEQRNKQNNHLARFGGHERSVGDHEARAGDLGLRSCGHDDGLVNSGSRVTDPGARASVFGLTPRDWMSSKIGRTSNLGQAKWGTPGTRVEGTAAKLDQSEIKNRVGYPGAKQSSVGGNGVAGASHISEAQQHARGSNLSARTATTEKNRLSIGLISSLPRTPIPISSVLRNSEDKQPIKPNKDILPKRMTGKASAIPVPASNDAGKSKTLPKDLYKHISPPPLQPPTIFVTNLLNLATNKAHLENVINENEKTVVSRHSFRDPESDIRSMKLGSVKEVIDVFKNSSEETQTELINFEKSKASVSVNEGVQTNIEAKEQHRQEESGSSKLKVNSCACMCALCCKRDLSVVLATVDPEENIISIKNKGGVINLKLSIEVRNIVRSVYSCQKNCLLSRSLTNMMRSEKKNLTSIEDGMFVRRKSSLQSILNHQYFRGYGFMSSLKLMVVQCAGCGRLNYLPCELPSCCDDDKKYSYFVLVANSVNEDMDDCCNFNPPCQPCNLRQSQLKNRSSGFPIKQTLSEMTLDTITTVTVSGMPVHSRKIGKKLDTSCQSEEPQGVCMMTKRKISISEDSGTRCDFQKDSGSSICLTMQVDNINTRHSYRKLCLQKCTHEDSQMCSEFCPPVASYQKVQSVCSQVSSQACPQVQSKGCQQTDYQVQLEECMPVSPTCSPCSKPLPSIQVQSQVCPQVPQASDAQTQTQWSNIVLQARLHPDGRYSFRLPPLNVLSNFPF